MSNAVFPVLPGLVWDVKKTPQWSTKLQQAASGKELRLSYYSWPIYKYTLAYEVLRQASAYLELQTLAGFFNARQGKFDSFLFQDPNDNAVTAHGFGMGDGTTTAFQLQRTAAGPRQADAISGIVPVYTTPRTNLLTWSEDLSNAAWTKGTGVTVAAQGSVAPGNNPAAMAYKVSYDGTGVANVSRLFASAGTSINLQAYTDSVFLRADAPATFLLKDNFGNVTTCNVTTVWQRFTVTGTGNGASTTQLLLFQAAGVNTAFALYMWGAQVETGTTATQYIRTAGAAVTQAPAYWPLTADGFEPVYDLNTLPQVPQLFVNGTLKTLGTDYTISSSALVTFTVAPAANAALTWTGSYYWRCRFDQDLSEFNNFLTQLWELKQLSFVTVK
jgi:hypothetical protein